MSKLKDAPLAITFDDVTLIPRHSEIKSRHDPSININLPTLKAKIPIISSPMNTITESDMANTMLELGGIAVLHRYMDIDSQVKMAKDLIDEWTAKNPETLENLFVAVGANGDVKERVTKLLEVGVKSICVDVANGHSAHCINTVKMIKELNANIKIMAGNVCTYEGAYNLAEAGTDLIRIGLGVGSLCSTRLVTGHGVPQLSAIEDCVRIKWKGNGFSDNSLVPSKFYNVIIISDGGIRSSGDAIKAFVAGADVIMVGGVLSGTSDTPGETIAGAGNTLYKHYHGMASTEARNSWFEHSKTSFVPEGVSTTVPYKGSTKTIIENFVNGIRVGMSYAGASNLDELRKNAQWVRVSAAGKIEGTPYGKQK